MSEDEFVVLLEHAGVVETADDSAREFVEQAQLLAWLERDGIELFTSPAVLANRAGASAADAMPSAAALPAGDGVHSTTLLAEARARLARRILERLLVREWLAPVAFDPSASGCDEWKGKIYAPRLTTAEAYRIYIEKDPSMEDRAPREQRVTPPAVAADDAQKARIREQLWQNCFPTCSESSRQMFLSFDNPEVILYSTMGLNLISNGISSVPAFSRELKNMGVSAEDRSVIVGFLAKAFPCD